MEPTPPTPATSDASVTVVVVPRERFSVSLRALTTLYRNTDHPFRLVYVDGNSPAPIRDRLLEEAGRYGFEVVRTERYLSPNQARNLGLAHVDTPYVVFLDNDVIVTPGWLSALVGCAEETGASVVGPLNFEGDLDDLEIHNAGGFLTMEDEQGRRMLEQDNRYGHRPHTALPPDLRRMPVDYVEFHCVLVRRSALEAIGGLDERLLSTREHLDLCLQVAATGGTVWSELTSLVTYDHPPPITRHDLVFFLLRWSEEWNVASLRHFIAKHGLSPDYLYRAGASRTRRWLVFEPLRARIERTFGAAAGRAAGRVLIAAERQFNQLAIGPLARSVAARSQDRTGHLPPTVRAA